MVAVVLGRNLFSSLALTSSDQPSDEYEFAPYLHQEEIELLSRYVLNGSTVLEYGSGGSTLYFSDRGKFNVSSWSTVDHNPKWAAAVLEGIHDRALKHSENPDAFADVWSKVRLSFVPADRSDWGGEPLLYEEGSLHEYNEYVFSLIHAAQGKEIDGPVLVINDGRARVDVGIAVLALLKKTGGLMGEFSPTPNLLDVFFPISHFSLRFLSFCYLASCSPT